MTDRWYTNSSGVAQGHVFSLNQCQLWHNWSALLSLIATHCTLGNNFQIGSTIHSAKLYYLFTCFTVFFLHFFQLKDLGRWFPSVPRASINKWRNYFWWKKLKKAVNIDVCYSQVQCGVTMAGCMLVLVPGVIWLETMTAITRTQSHGNPDPLGTCTLYIRRVEAPAILSCALLTITSNLAT